MTMKMGICLATLAALTLAGATPAATLQQSPVIEGTWTGRFRADDDDRGDRFRLQRWDEDGWRSAMSLPDDAVAELLRQARVNDGVVRYTLTREAGTIELEGRISDGRGRGTFTFREAPAFRGQMEALGLRRVDGDDVFAAAVHDVGTESVRELRSLGFDPDWGDVMAASIFHVDRGFVQEVRDAGFEGTSLQQLVAFRVHGITPGYVAEARSMGLGRLEEGDILAMKIHHIDADFVREARSLGLGRLDFNDVMAMKIHGVDRAFVEGLTAEGIELDELDDVMALRIHDITPEYVRELMAEGFEDLDADELLKIRIHGLDRILTKRRRR